ncbi:ATP synthase subunit delta [Geobacter sp. OR-1]|uniref:ATP synthase F1 subunit delta n=1 Tax=Geobacter sp. OR-1 TaxID=1266765 RepID=UPI000542E3CF|nr:ATP synthase F1 subunit delta [Geobacter sp. OR-1]GAM11279.1 ATP synthase subunit delta [Geobacter sp. OR-1]
MSASAIARRYAKALVQLGAESNSVEAFNAELARISDTLDSNRNLLALFSNPAYGVDAKKEILRDIAAKLAISPMVGNLLQLLLDRNRIACLPQIAASYAKLADDLSGVVRPVVTSGMPLADQQIADIKGALEKSTGKKVELTVQVDPALIGGVVTKIGDRVFDGSVKTQLNKIQDILQKG